ncbi:MAG: tRNA (N(6)-L-threonylcarbamoyladenosine(37)-C(2))-methylthiotransferase MtaB [Bacteroidales bacterium]|nr:tRNA (N(6)-L-threonylcarbamoyladenosine(37)-C(2))-methylthiotransferase MtaB [Bacteroidales bacterium]
MKIDNRKRVAFFTLGCKLNFSETSTISRDFNSNNYDVVPFNEVADVYVINTCSVTEQADKKCRQTIKKIIKQNPDAYVAVVGCYAQLKPKEIAEIPGVDIVLGSKDKMNLFTHIDKLQKHPQAEVHTCETKALRDFSPAYSQGDRTRSFLKVQDGCDYFCSYCTIPLARGRSRSNSVAETVKQAEEIAKSGIKEVILTGVNIGDFGRSTGESFFDLVKALDQVEGIERIRISSIEPNLITNEIIDYVAQSNKFLPHFHIPLQAGTDHILKLMRRKYDTALFANRIKYIKKVIPDAFIGVDLIAGFPGESDELFEQTCNFIEGLDISFLHVFSYSERPNTSTIRMEGKVDAKTINERSKTLHNISDKKHIEFYRSQNGSVRPVLFEHTKKSGVTYGYTDNYIKVEVISDNDLTGKIININLEELKDTPVYIGRVEE